jgi:uncharacterized protein YxjI
VQNIDKNDVKTGDRIAGPLVVEKTATKCEKKMVSIGDDFWIENSAGKRTYKVDGKALCVRDTLNFEDAHGNLVAMVKKKLITPVRDKFTVNIKNGPDLEVKGNIVDHQYTIGEGRDKVADVSKKWFRVRDSYGVEIDPGQDDIVILAVTVCIDQMAH